eukprot:940757-Amphidinium_carterae.1
MLYQLITIGNLPTMYCLSCCDTDADCPFTIRMCFSVRFSRPTLDQMTPSPLPDAHMCWVAYMAVMR